MKKIRVIINRDALTQILLKRNMTFNDLAEGITVDSTYLYRLASGQRYVSARMRTLLLEYLDVDFDEIFIIKEISYVNKHLNLTELHLSKNDLNELLNGQSKEIAICNDIVLLKMLNERE
ncbi:helix-turn-helix transcriptional regulator [Staphylococcus epidermidis]|nr:helix-turn-helix transcriptional regulator [Staphylococcus epidermidis]